PDEHRPPHVSLSAPPLSRPARRMIVLLVDGLPFQEALELESIAALAKRGASREVLADFPSFTYPSMVTIATGLPPRWSGVRINADGPFAKWDSVFARAAGAGIEVGIAPDG